MPHGKRRIAQADDVIDRCAVGRDADIGQPGGEVGGALAAEAILRRHDEVGLVTGGTAGRHEIAGDDEMPPFDERRARRDDQNAHRGGRYS